MDPIELGKHLRASRKKKDLTLVELSKQSGVSNPYISQIENGKFKPSPDILKKLSAVLGESYIDLLRAAGYDEIIEVVGPIEAIADFAEWNDVALLAARLNTLERALDIKVLLEQELLTFKAENIKPFYNGHSLKEQDRQRILSMLETLFPDYLVPGTDLEK